MLATTTAAMVFNARTKASEKDDPGSSEQAGM